MGDIKYTETKVIILVTFFLMIMLSDILWPDLPFVPSVPNPFVH